MRPRFSPASSGGFTLVEMMLAVGLTGILLMAISVSYQSVLHLQSTIFTRLPLAQAASNAGTVVAQNVRSATCIKTPSAGESGPLLLGWTGQDCDVSIPPFAAVPGYFIVCQDSNKRLMFKNGTGTPSSAPCTPDSGWYALTPMDVQAAARFTRDPKTRNIVVADIVFSQPTGISGAKSDVPSLHWHSTFSAQMSLDSSGPPPACVPTCPDPKTIACDSLSHPADGCGGYCDGTYCAKGQCMPPMPGIIGWGGNFCGCPGYPYFACP